MTIELEDLSNGSAKSARFPVKYRGARRENMPREDLATGTDFGGPTGGAPGESTGLELVGASERSTDHHPAAPDAGAPGLDAHAVSVTPSATGPDRSTIPAEALVDHPLLRGLLLALPPRGSAPDTEWLDCWFEAARSILELLYVQETVRSR